MSILGLITLVLHGTLAGLYYSFSMSVIPGLKAIDADAADTAMRSMNRKILSPWLFVPFFGAPILALVSGLFAEGSSALWFFAAAAVSFVGSLVVTVVVNIPLNNSLDSKRIGFSEFHPRWNTFNVLRAVSSVASLVLVGVGLTG
jgi:uncharacterized membrane protein